MTCYCTNATKQLRANQQHPVAPPTHMYITSSSTCTCMYTTTSESWWIEIIEISDRQ